MDVIKDESGQTLFIHSENEMIYEDCLTFSPNDKGYQDFINFIEDFFRIKNIN